MTISKLNRFLTTLTALTLAVAAILTTPFLTQAFDISKHVAVYPLILILVAALMLKFIVAKKIVLLCSRTDILLLLFAVLAGLSYLTAGNQFVAFYGVYGRFFGVATLLTFVMWYFITRQSLVADVSSERMMRWLNGVLVAVSAYGILQYFGVDIFTYEGVTFSSHGAFATFSNPNLFGGFLVLLLPLPFVFFLKNTKDKYYYLLSFFLGCTALMLTFTRGSWLAALISILLLAFFTIGNSKIAKKVWTLLGTGVIAFLLIFIITSASPATDADVGQRLSSLAEGGGSVKERLLIYDIGLKSADDKPILGYGPDHFVYAFYMNETREFADLTNELTKVDNAHNYFLQLGVTLGIPAAILLALFLVIRLYKVLVSLLGNRREKSFDPVMLAAFAGVIGYIGHIKFSVEDFSSLLVMFAFLAVLANKTDRSNLTGTGPGEEPGSDKAAFGVAKSALLWMVTLAVLGTTVCFGYAYYKYWTADTAYLQAKKYEAIDDTVNADKYLTLAKARAGGNAYYYYRSGQYYYEKSFELNNIDLAFTAAADLEKAASLDPVDVDIRLALAKSYMDLADLDEKIKKDKAVTELKKTIALSPNYRSAHLLLGVVLIQKDDPKSALTSLESARNIDPDYLPTYYYLGLANHKLGNIDAAKENYLKAAGDPDFKAQAEAALKELDKGSEEDSRK